MPYITNTTYAPPFGFNNPHVQSIFPQVCRHVSGITYTRERISTTDNDFIDLDWCSIESTRCAILFHGLEGHTRRSYMLGMSKALHRAGWNTVSANFRGCSGEPNRTIRMYHHGVTDDLYTVLNHVVSKNYREIALIGFSLGGNVILKYLGENIFPIPSQLKCSVAISAPCDLNSCAAKMDQKGSAFYRRRFLKMLSKKVKEKKRHFPSIIDDHGIETITTFEEYDNRFTAPFHGFTNAHDYYVKCASLQFLPSITSPVLLINSLDDPFLTPSCNPVNIAEKSSNLYLETPAHGGHVGFISFDKSGNYWHEKRSVEFLEKMTRLA